VSPYAYCLNNAINYIDPDGQFSSPFSAWIYKLFHGGGETYKDAKTGEYFVSKQSSSKTANGETVIIATRRFDWNGRNSGEKQYDQTETGEIGFRSESNIETPTISIENQINTNTNIIDVAFYSTTTIKKGNSNTEITINGTTKQKEAETTTNLGIIKTSIQTDGSGGSIGIGAVSVGRKDRAITLGVSQKIYGSNTTVGIITTINAKDLILIPILFVAPESTFELRPVLIP
jgi:hypothetical protein